MQEVWIVGAGSSTWSLPQGKRFHLLQEVHSADMDVARLWTGYAGDVFPGLTESIDSKNTTSIKV